MLKYLVFYFKIFPSRLRQSPCLLRGLHSQRGESHQQVAQGLLPLNLVNDNTVHNTLLGLQHIFAE